MRGVLSRWRALPVPVRDGVLAVGLTVAGQVELLAADELGGPRGLQHVAFAVMTASLVARRARPVGAAVVGAAGLAFQTVLGEAPAVAGFVAVLVLTYSVAQYADRRRDAVLGLLAVLAAVQVYPFVADRPVNAADEVANMAIPVVVWVFARLARERLDWAVAAEREAVAARERERRQEAERAGALAAERRRIAREMHDVVGHGVTLMLLHAEAAQASLGAREPATARALDVVLASGRTALDDLHRMLRVLREHPEEGPADPLPGSIAAIEELVVAARAAGRDVEMTADGAVPPLPAAVEATAYRIVQESLTNALRHAPGAPISVVLEFAAEALTVEVSDDGPGGGDPGRAGHGLLGLRERVALFDGCLTAGPRADGTGWTIRAVLPVPVPEHAAV
ncbi:sensor histidine kinase [Blastococcus sp. SYSU DS0753]